MKHYSVMTSSFVSYDVLFSYDVPFVTQLRRPFRYSYDVPSALGYDVPLVRILNIVHSKEFFDCWKCKLKKCLSYR